MSLLSSSRSSSTPTDDGSSGNVSVTRKRCHSCLDTKIRKIMKYSCQLCSQYLYLELCVFVCVNGYDVTISKDENKDKDSRFERSSICCASTFHSVQTCKLKAY